MAIIDMSALGTVTGLANTDFLWVVKAGTPYFSSIDDLFDLIQASDLPTHTHAIADSTGLQSALDGKAATSHSHVIGNVTGLQTEIDTKLDVALNMVNPADDTWQGRTVAAIAGETMVAGDQWKVLHAKDTGSGTRWYFYDADTGDPDNDSYTPLALLVTAATINAGDAITITYGDGIVANDGWGSAYTSVGKALYCSTTPGGVTTTRPTVPGDHVKQIGTLLNITANGRDVWDISFRYPDTVVPA